MEQLRIIVTFVILGIAMITDWKSARIYNWLIWCGLSAGGVICLLDGTPAAGKSLLLGMLIPVVLLWIPFLMRGIGAGDVKLFIVLGSLSGGADVFYTICISILLAAGFSLGRLLSHRQLKHSLSLCIQFIQTLFLEQKIIPWEGAEGSLHRIRMANFIMLGYVICLGVKLCKQLPL